MAHPLNRSVGHVASQQTSLKGALETLAHKFGTDMQRVITQLFAFRDRLERVRGSAEDGSGRLKAEVSGVMRTLQELVKQVR